MKYCSRCLYPENHPLMITFDDEGVCSGCRVHEEKYFIDWEERAAKLKSIVEPYRSHKRNVHDCIVPVSGARDSFFIVHYVKHVLKLNPLLVTYNKQYNTQVGIRNLAYLRSQLGADIMTMTVSPERVKRITNETLRLRGSMYWHCLAGQTVFPVQIAVKFKIPLIIWGAHQGVDQVGMFSHLDEVEMTRKYRKEHDLMNLEAENLLKASQNLTEADVTQYVYPHDKELEAIGVRGIYLNNYMFWDTKAQHEVMIKHYGYESAPQQRTFDTYNDVDCFHYSGLHDYIKYIKWGYGKVSDHASREIRLKRMTREQGIEWVKHYEQSLPNDIGLFLEWLNMGSDELETMISIHRNSFAWHIIDGQWELKDSVSNHINDDLVEAVRLQQNDDCKFLVTPSKIPGEVDKNYTLVGRGWADDWSMNKKVAS